MVSSFSLSRLMEEQITALIRAGYYSSKSDVVKDAMRIMMKTKPNLRHAAAIEMLKEGKITLGKAAEIAEVSVDEFRQMLEHHKVLKEVRGDREDLERISEIK